MKDLVKKTPIPTAGVALGLASLGILLQPYSEALHIAAGALSLCLLLLLGTKIAGYSRMVREDLKNPIFAGVFATLFMTLMQLATYLVPYSFIAALVLWCAAILAHFCLMAWFSFTFIFKFDLKQVFPTHFIAYVGIIVASLTSPAFGLEYFGLAIFWFGLACFTLLLVVMVYRYVKHEVPESAKPLFCIFAAPMSLSLAGYLTVATEPETMLVLVMAILAQLSLVVVLTQLPKLLRLSFYPSYAAMTFPFVVCATALAKATVYFEMLGINEVVLLVLNGLVVAETVFATVMVLYVLACYLRFFFVRTARSAGRQAQATGIPAAITARSQSSLQSLPAHKAS